MAKVQAVIKAKAEARAKAGKAKQPVVIKPLTVEEFAEKAKGRKARKLVKNQKRRERQKVAAEVEVGRKAKEAEDKRLTDKALADEAELVAVMDAQAKANKEATVEPDEAQAEVDGLSRIAAVVHATMASTPVSVTQVAEPSKEPVEPAKTE